ARSRLEDPPVSNGTLQSAARKSRPVRAGRCFYGQHQVCPAPARRSVVMASQGDLRHQAFFQELTQLELSDESWREVSAGLVTLRLVDAWFEHGASIMSPDGWNLRAIRDEIGFIGARRQVRGILSEIVDVIEASEKRDANAVFPRLRAYARELDFESKGALAMDVYRT